MKNLSNSSASIVGIVVVAVLVFVVVRVFGSAMQDSNTGAVATHTPPVAATLATDLDQAVAWENAELEQIRFGEAREVLKDVKALEIAGWMDDRHVLFTGDLENTHALQSVDVRSGAVARYDEGIFIRTPLWLAKSTSVAYLWLNRKDNTKQVRISSGKPGDAPRILATSVGFPFLFALPNGKGVLSIAPDLKSINAVSADAAERTPTALDFRKFAPADSRFELFYRSAQSPNREWGAFFNRDHFVLLHLTTNMILEVLLPEEKSEIGQGRWWALDAAWSRDNTQLAIIATIEDLPNSFRRLYIYDLDTGLLRQTALPTPFVLNNLAWTPNNRILLVQGTIGQLEGGYGEQGTHLIDITNKQVLPTKVFPPRTIGSSDSSVAWSPNGRWLAFYCNTPEPEPASICISSVEVTQ